ncbi:alpha/beta hydrolase [Candidatus Neomarinimicrobiota bacterium]
MSKHIISVLIVFIAFVFSSASYAQESNTDSTKSIKTDSLYFKSESLFKCNIRLPKNFNPADTHTLVIGLHGGGSTPEAFIKIWDKIKDVDFIYAAPQGPYSILFDELGNEWSLWSSSDLNIREQAANLIGDYIADLVKELKELYKINDIYLSGFSQGAVFTYVAGFKNHQLYKGIIIFSGPGIFKPLGDEEFAPNWLEEKYLEPAKKLRVFIAHGTKDQRVEYELGLKSKEVLTSYGYDVSFHSFDGGHTIDPEILKQTLEWINKE